MKKPPPVRRVIADLTEQVRGMVERSGRPTGFDCESWLAEWLNTPNRALAGRPPMQFLNTSEGVQIVRHLLSQMETGAYS